MGFLERLGPHLNLCLVEACMRSFAGGDHTWACSRLYSDCDEAPRPEDITIGLFLNLGLVYA